MQPAALTWAPPLYFLFFAASASLSPFLVVYYQELGLTGTQIGILAGLPSLISLVSAPIWGLVSDRTHRHKLLLLIAMAGAILAALTLSVFDTFLWLLPVVTLFAFFYSPVMPLVDSTTMHLLGGHKERYGRIRMWGAVGWGVTAPIIGWLIESGSVMSSFWSYAVLMGLGLLVAVRIPVSGPIGEASKGDIRKFLTDARWLVFLGAAFFGGMLLSIISNFLFIYLSELGADKFTMGLTLTFATLSEVPVLFFSNHFLKRWSAGHLLIAAMLIFAVRALAYSFILVPWLALLIQLLHGPTFSLMWIAGVSYSNKIAPEGMAATAQALFSGVMMGVGSAAGAFFGGTFYEHFGLVNMFRLAALIALLVGGVMLRMEKKNHAASF